MSVQPCCTSGFTWTGTPTGRISKLNNQDTYITGTNPDRCILLIHDLFGWTFPNTRLLADFYARHVKATVFVPDFFGGETLPFEPIAREKWDEIDLAGYMARNGREQREEEVLECARTLRAEGEWGFKKIGAVGFCYGGWAVFRLGAKEHGPTQPLVDCISAGHPTFLTKQDIDNVGVPTQILAPEHDAVYTPEMKTYTFETIQKNAAGVPFDYQFFPGVVHSCFVRGDPDLQGEREAMLRGMNAVVGWMGQFLGVDETVKEGMRI